MNDELKADRGQLSGARGQLFKPLLRTLDPRARTTDN
jgi:hypothetical protein